MYLNAFCFESDVDRCERLEKFREMSFRLFAKTKLPLSGIY